VGAKQNRIVNTTILIQEKTTTMIPVSCVEQGRWAHTSPRFDSEERLMTAQLRAMKSEQVHRSIRTTDDFYSDQAAIWKEISQKARRMRAESPTMAMSEIYEKKRTALNGYINHFRLVEMQVGAVFMINSKVVGLDCFGKPETFSKVFRKLVESYALDAIDWSEQESSGKAPKSDVTKFLWHMRNRFFTVRCLPEGTATARNVTAPGCRGIPPGGKVGEVNKGNLSPAPFRETQGRSRTLRAQRKIYN
jgi:hypothetical protein